jgi:outer membrane biogenesis lipoprotein LolB
MRVCVVLLLLLSGSTLLGADHQWRWVKAGNNAATGWDVSQGDAEVSIKDGKFSAKLFWKDSGKDVQIILQGSIRNGQITTKETVQGSDYTGSIYHGTLQRKKWGEVFAGTTGAESITLSDGWNMIGITRGLE